MLHQNVTIAGSIEPERVPIMRPSSGVKPIDVSMTVIDCRYRTTIAQMTGDDAKIAQVFTKDRSGAFGKIPDGTYHGTHICGRRNSPVVFV